MNEGIVNNLRLAADKWENNHPVIGVGELRVHEALRDAARCIEETSAKIPEWISVEDRLPDVSGLYIVCCNDEGSCYGEGIWYASGVIVCADTYVDENGRVTWGWCEGATEYDLDGIVTHWMPMPEPPVK